MDSSISPEKRLQLIKRIRSKQYQNSHILKDRESILYGKPPLIYDSYAEEGQDYYAYDNFKPISTFYLRMIIALFLFGAFYVMNQEQSSFAGIDSKQVYSAIEQDYCTNIFDFINQISYTLKE